MKKNHDEDMPSLFDIYEQQDFSAAKLDVVRLDYVSAEPMTWQELFCGYQRLYAITYSSGINFVYKLLDMFEEAQIIFGCEAVISYSLQAVMAYQNQLLKRMRESASGSMQKLLDRIDNGSVHFYAASRQISHEKIYLLEADDGRKRVIMGSANMSYNAFSGMQRENICYIDGAEAFDWYMSCFADLMENSSDEISKKALTTADLDENLDALPISEKVKLKKALIVEPCEDKLEDVRFILDIHRSAGDIAPVLPKKDKKTGRTLLSPDSITRIRRHRIEETVKEKELRSEYPQLVIDAANHSASLNDEALDLSPSPEDIASDVGLFLKYMDGYSRFHGDYLGMQYRYFEFANWFFCSPFMAVMRDMAARFNQNKLPYPVFGLLYGQSKAGKTSFLETLLKMMIGQKPKISAPDFTRSGIEDLKRKVMGAPIIVDDLTQTRFSQHAIETIKNDDFGVSEHLVNYSAVVISANEDVKAVAPEVIRRTVICRVEAGLTNTEVMKSNVVRMVQQKIGTAFYREYLRRMLDIIPDLTEEMKNDEAECAPDILARSSGVIVAIIREHCDSLPEYIRELTLEDYFSEHVTGKHAKDSIVNAWRTSPGSFSVDKKMNELRFNAGQTYEADRLLKELPETLEAYKVRESVVMNLDEARKFFGIDFKPSFFRRGK